MLRPPTPVPSTEMVRTCAPNQMYPRKTTTLKSRATSASQRLQRESMLQNPRIIPASTPSAAPPPRYPATARVRNPSGAVSFPCFFPRGKNHAARQNRARKAADPSSSRSHAPTPRDKNRAVHLLSRGRRRTLRRPVRPPLEPLPHGGSFNAQSGRHQPARVCATAPANPSCAAS